MKKIAAEIIAKLYKWLKLLHNGQFRSRKLRKAIDAITKLIAIVEQIWKNKKIAKTLFLNIKKVFSNIIRQ